MWLQICQRFGLAPRREEFSLLQYNIGRILRNIDLYRMRQTSADLSIQQKQKVREVSRCLAHSVKVDVRRIRPILKNEILRKYGRGFQHHISIDIFNYIIV
jgi:hypothetical protein